MKQILAVAVAGALFVPRAVSASENIIGAQKIAFTSFLPAEVRKAVPSRGKSYFWGTFRLKPGEPMLGLHLFKRDRRQGQNRDSTEQQFTLDVLRQEGKTWKRFNRILIRYPSSTWGQNRVDVQSLWLDATRQIPILKFYIFTPGAEGPIGDEAAAIFTQGLAKPAAMQSWGRGSWFSSNSLGQDNSWNTRDEKGFLRVISTYDGLEAPDETGEAIVQSITTWTWQGQSFKPGKTVTKRRNQPDPKEADATLSRIR